MELKSTQLGPPEEQTLVPDYVYNAGQLAFLQLATELQVQASEDAARNPSNDNLLAERALSYWGTTALANPNRYPGQEY